MWSNGGVDGADPIEVELTSHEERPTRRGWRRRADQPHEWSPERPAALDEDGASVRDGEDTGPEHSALATERGRLVTTGVVVGVVALLLGWMLGRSGDGDDVATAVDDSATTTTAPRSTLPIVGDSVAPPDFEIEEEPAAQPVTTRPTGTIRATTVEAPEPTVEPIGVDPRLLGVPIRLVGVDAGSSLVEVDLATGTLTDYHVGRISMDNSGLIVGPEWVVFGGGGAAARVVWSDGSESRLTLGDAWRPLHVAGTETFWRSPQNGPGRDGFELELVDIDGEALGVTIELPVQSWPQMVDPLTGGLTVSGGYSRSYVFTPDGVEYLGIGMLNAITADAVIVYDCDEQFVCGLHRIDRATGERTPIPLDPALAGDVQLQPSFYFGDSASMSPDGRWMSVVASGWSSSVAGLVDIETGRFVEFGGFEWPPSIGWSPDGRYAFAVNSLSVTVFDTVADEIFPVFTDAVRWTRVGVRPVDLEDVSPAEETVEP